MTGRIRLSPRIAWRGFRSKTVLLDLGTGRHYSLNPTGGLIWKLLDKRYPPARIVNALCAAYGVRPPRAQRDYRKFVAWLRRSGLLSRSSPKPFRP